MERNESHAFSTGLRKPAAASPAFELSAEVGRTVIGFTDYENFYHGWRHGFLPLVQRLQIRGMRGTHSENLRMAHQGIVDRLEDVSKKTGGRIGSYLHWKFTTFPQPVGYMSVKCLQVKCDG